MRRAIAACVSACWLSSLGCTPVVQPGLANAPGLGGSTAVDARVHDVIANGQDSCGRRFAPDPGPLRYRVPPCLHESVPKASTAFAPSGPHDDPGGLRWMEHYYFGWPACEAVRDAQLGGRVLAWSAASSVADACR